MRPRTRSLPRASVLLALAWMSLVGPARLHVPAAHAAPAEVLGLPLPPATRIDTRMNPAPGERGQRFVSGRGFRATVEHYQRVLARRGLLHEAIPVYRYRGVVVARFLSRQAGTPWSAVHVYQQDARTWIFILPASP
jgi:hypothetical protein